MAKSREANGAVPQTIEQLGERFRKLDKQKTTAEANLKHAETQLEKLRSEAQQKFGTDDLAQLEKKLAEMEAENEKRRSDYQTALDGIEQQLSAIETDFAAAPAGGPAF